MKTLLIAALLWIGLTGLAKPATAETGYVNDLDFVTQTDIPGPDGAPYALCHTTRALRLFGLTLNRVKTGFALSPDNCMSSSTSRSFTAEQMEIAQSLGLVDSDIPAINEHVWQSSLINYGLWGAAILALLMVIIRRIRSIFGLVPGAPLRRKAVRRILRAMCQMGKCHGIVAAAELRLIGDTIQRVTGRAVPAAEIMRVADQIDDAPSPADYIAFGQGLFDHEKDAMIRGVLSVAMARGRVFPDEYQFVTGLAHGLGMPAEDFRRVLDMAISDRAMGLA